MRCQGQAFQFLVVAAVLPHESWVKPRVLADPAENRRTLGHEQTHFNLTEVYARRMRKYFAEFINPCTASGDLLKTSAERLVRDESAAQALYDLETQHGLAPTRQKAWDTDVSEMLTSLKKFERQ
jgi:hypothetical protein